MLEKLEKMITPAVEALGLVLYGCELQACSGTTTLLVYVDRLENGVTLEDCASASRQITAILNVEGPVRDYALQVSSPGVERPLFSLAHYERVLGQQVRLKLRHFHQGRRNFTGVVKQVVDQQVTLMPADSEAVTLDFAQIEKATLIAGF